MRGIATHAGAASVRSLSGTRCERLLAKQATFLLFSTREIGVAS
jgi:hypothetical protein